MRRKGIGQEDHTHITLQPIIYNKDIKELEEKNSLSPMEAMLLRYHNALETKIQSHFRNRVNQIKKEILFLDSKGKIEFIQFDNGAKLTDTGRLKKWREGTVSGFSDSMILLSDCNQRNKIIFCEIKRIGTPSQVKINPKQQYWRDRLNNMGWSAYITNNPAFFENVICEEIRGFFNK